MVTFHPYLCATHYVVEDGPLMEDFEKLLFLFNDISEDWESCFGAFDTIQTRLDDHSWGIEGFNFYVGDGPGSSWQPQNLRLHTRISAEFLALLNQAHEQKLTWVRIIWEHEDLDQVFQGIPEPIDPDEYHE